MSMVDALADFNAGWQQILSDDFHAGWAEDIHFMSPLGLAPHRIPGYALRVQRRGHRTCSCQRGQMITIWRPHNDATGDWPVNMRVLTEYGNAFLRANPNMERTPSQFPDPQYGWVYASTALICSSSIWSFNDQLSGRCELRLL